MQSIVVNPIVEIEHPEKKNRIRSERKRWRKIMLIKKQMKVEKKEQRQKNERVMKMLKHKKFCRQKKREKEEKRGRGAVTASCNKINIGWKLLQHPIL